MPLTSKQIWILILSTLASLLISVDVTAVNLILAPISSALHFPITKTQWVTNAYLLIYSAFIIAGGRLGDLLGHKKITLIGLVIFAFGSFITAISQNLTTIIVARLFQGVGAALVQPNTLTIIYHAFPKERRGFVSGISSSTIAAAIAMGPFFGGILTQIYSWRLLFIINIPLSIFMIILGGFFFPKHSDIKKLDIKKIDLSGIALLGAFLFCSVGVFDVLKNAMQNYIIFISLIMMSLLFYVLFILNEKKSPAPLLSTEIVENKLLLLCCLLRFLYGLPIMLLVYILALYMQIAIGYSTSAAGLMFLPFTISMIFLSPYIGKWVDKIGFHVPILIGVIISIVSFLGFSMTSVNTPIKFFIILFALAGLGVGFVRPGLVTATVKMAPKGQLGLVNAASSVLNNFGGSIGIAIAAFIMSISKQTSTKMTLLHSMPIIMYFCTTVMLLIALLVFIKIQPKSNIQTIAQEA